MSIYSKLYWLTRLDGLQGLFITLTVVAFIAAIVIIIWKFISQDFDEFHYNKELENRVSQRIVIVSKLKLLIPFGFIFLIFSIMTPTKNEVIFIIAGGKTIDFVQTDTSISKIPAQTTQIISSFLDEQIKEIEGK